MLSSSCSRQAAAGATRHMPRGRCHAAHATAAHWAMAQVGSYLKWRGGADLNHSYMQRKSVNTEPGCKYAGGRAGGRAGTCAHAYAGTHARTHARTHTRVHACTRARTRAQMQVYALGAAQRAQDGLAVCQLCIGMCLDMCIDMCIDMCVENCMDMCVETCVWTCVWKCV